MFHTPQHKQSIDYKRLLRKYIQHVCECEGITFIDRINDIYDDSVVFTEQEVIEMQLLAKDKSPL